MNQSPNDLPSSVAGLRKPTCSNVGESYEVDELGSLPRQSDEHPVETSQNVIIKDGEVALRIRASCECGWSDTEVLK